MFVALQLQRCGAGCDGLHCLVLPAVMSTRLALLSLAPFGAQLRLDSVSLRVSVWVYAVQGAADCYLAQPSRLAVAADCYLAHLRSWAGRLQLVVATLQQH
jgi:hypothetical protein